MLEEIVKKICRQQSKGNTRYDRGLFPSQRIHKQAKYVREDNNIFFSALIVFTLQQLKHAIPAKLLPRIETLIEDVVSNYSKYRHPADTQTYNFWQHHPNSHFPHGIVMKRLPFLALPADVDDTSIIYLTSPSTDRLENIKIKLETHYAREAPVSAMTPVAYRDLRPYPTFLGRKVKREMDVCVICNVLYLVFKNKLPLSATDLDSIEFIHRVLVRQDYQKSPFFISPNYGNPAVILYHIARLAGAFDHAELNKIRALLIKILKQEFLSDNSLMESLLINTSLLRFKVSTPLLTPNRNLEHYFKNFYFFQAGMLTSLQRFNLHKLASVSFFHLKYRCYAYYWTLWLEYNLLYQQINQDHQVQT